MPGGHLESKESMVAAAARELEEETGLTAEKFSFVALVNNPRKDQKNHYIQLGFLAEGIAGTLELREPERCYEWQWFDIDNLPKPIFSGHDRIIKLYKEGKANFSDES